MTRIPALIAGAAMLLPAALQAQTAAPAASATPAAATPTVGAAVYDGAGAPVGTIDAVTPQGAVVSTGTNKVMLPSTAIGAGPKGLTIGMTKVELDAAAAKAQADATAQFKAKLVAGTPVNAMNGGPVVGTIKEADDQFVTLTTTSKGDAKLPIAGFGPSPTGGVVLGMTAAQLDAALAPAKK